ncbi:radical SAM protein [Suipraeoptans intestinalis]|uniref:radical SAM protein n=1 Tax=Suipraeoptans intestinalis TaxID=2606628 RepID=UPI002A7533C2|nr:radical SAM protein [Suipraeoptans intestinalis]MDY3122450.1 radical SAM protein [Suipraeoptans intestinalis]
MSKVYIKCIATPDNFYFYDRFMDVVCKVSENEFNALLKVEQQQTLAGYEDSLKRLTSQGLLKESVVESVSHMDTSHLSFFAQSHLTTLVLQITQQCNFRCSYCIYGGNYFTREHSNEKMTWDLAKSAVDFYISHSFDEQEASISFYGGEPLLEFNLITQIVLYAEKRLKHKLLSFSMTTNGFLLDKHILDFLVSHNFRIMISLDGDESTHNANRKLKGGQNTFTKVYTNILTIKREYPDFFNSRVTYNAVFSNTTDLKESFNLFADSGIFSPLNISINFVDSSDMKDDQLIYKHNKKKDYLNYEYLKLLAAQIGMKKVDNRILLIVNMFSNFRKLYDSLRIHYPEQKIMAHNGPCLPGINKLFVTVNGLFYPCERVAENRCDLCIGCIDTGFNFETMRNILNPCKPLESKCLSCWNLRRCSFCSGMIETAGEEINASYVLNECENSKSRVINDLKDLCMLCEMGYGTNTNMIV